jgi:hypothetical protein
MTSIDSYRDGEPCIKATPHDHPCFCKRGLLPGPLGDGNRFRRASAVPQKMEGQGQEHLGLVVLVLKFVKYTWGLLCRPKLIIKKKKKKKKITIGGVLQHLTTNPETRYTLMQVTSKPLDHPKNCLIIVWVLSK